MLSMLLGSGPLKDLSHVILSTADKVPLEGKNLNAIGL